MKYIFLLLMLISLQSLVQSQSSVYHWNKKKDGIVLGTALGAWVGSQYLKSQADKITESDLPSRDPDNLWSIDRGATRTYSQKADQISDAFLYASFALPYTHYLGQTCRHEGWVITGMALQTFLITDASTNTIKAITKRFRPFTYNPDVPIENKLVPGARFSFVSGHSSNTAALGFFTAKVFSDMYPDNKWKPLVWALGVSLPAATGYMRYRAGKHFPTDIIGGYILGASVGYLVPHFHKISNEELSFMLIPSAGGMLLYASYNF